MTGQDRLQCPNCGANNMPGAVACWQCHMPFGGPDPHLPSFYPAYAARPPRRMSCWLGAFLALLFMLAGAGMTAYFLLRHPAMTPLPVPPLERQLEESSKLSPTEQALKSLKESAARVPGEGPIAGIRPGHSKREVLDKLGTPASVELGYLITEKNEELPREIWRYPYGWVMFRYETVVETGRGEPPILRPGSILYPGDNR